MTVPLRWHFPCVHPSSLLTLKECGLLNIGVAAAAVGDQSSGTAGPLKADPDLRSWHGETDGWSREIHQSGWDRKSVQKTCFLGVSRVWAEGIYPQSGEVAEQVGYLKIAALVSHVWRWVFCELSCLVCAPLLIYWGSEKRIKSLTWRGKSTTPSTMSNQAEQLS